MRPYNAHGVRKMLGQELSDRNLPLSSPLAAKPLMNL